MEYNLSKIIDDFLRASTIMTASQKEEVSLSLKICA